MSTNLFDVAEVNDGIAGTEFCGRITHLRTATSTMDLALEAAQAGARHGVWIVDEQLSGRGRGTNKWHSAPGDGLYMTALISPPIPMRSALQLSFGVAIAAATAIAATTGLRIRDQIDIRWPNDLMIARANGPQRKCGGILIDTTSEPAQPPRPAMLRYALLGIGLNLNHVDFPPELEQIATSLRRELVGQPLLRRESMVAAILCELDKTVRALTQDPNPEVQEPERYSSWLTGKRVRVEPREGELARAYVGTTAGLDAQGFLRVIADGGELRTVLSGGLRELDQ